MKAISSILYACALVGLLAGAGCTHFNSTGNRAPRLELTEFMNQLSSKGITAREEGPIRETTITSTFGERLLLNERDIVDVYFFRDAEQALKESNVAETLSRHEVYHSGTIVLFHRVSFDPLVRNALEDMFGLPK